MKSGPMFGTVVKRELDPANDPEAAEMAVLGRVKVKIPGEYEESPWAYPLGGGGAALWGVNRVPPMGALVAVWKVEAHVEAGDEILVYLPAHHGVGMTFPEFEHPDVIVTGDRNIRFVYDRRKGMRYAALQLIKEVNGAEDLICEFRIDVEGNGIRIRAETGLKIESGGQLTIDADGDIEIGGRKLARKAGMI